MVDLTQLGDIPAHPRGAAWLTPHADALCDEAGPVGTDRGHDAFFEYPSWRARAPTSSLPTYLRSILRDFHVDYRVPLDDAAIRVALEGDDSEIEQRLYTVDETILATGLAQIAFEGGLDAKARPLLATALLRQRHPRILARFFGDSNARSLALRACEEVFASVDRAPSADDRRQLAELGERALGSGWEKGTLAWARTQTPRILLMQFAEPTHEPMFVVLRWIEDRVPDEREVASLDVIGAFRPEQGVTPPFEPCGRAIVGFDPNRMGCESVRESAFAGYFARMAFKLEG
jgi:uncharacterized protein YfeS